MQLVLRVQRRPCTLAFQSSFPQPLATLFYPLQGSVVLGSTCEREHTQSVFLCLVYFTLHNVLPFHPCHCKWQHIFLLYSWLVFHCVCGLPFLYPLIC
jgi:hypothetical protein